MNNNYTVQQYLESVNDNQICFTGTLTECRQYLVGTDVDDLYEIIAPDGFTTVE